MKVDNLWLNQLSYKKSIHFDYWFVFAQSTDSELMFEDSSRVSNEAVVETNEVVAVGSDCLSLINCVKERVLKNAIFSEADDPEW